MDQALASLRIETWGISWKLEMDLDQALASLRIETSAGSTSGNTKLIRLSRACGLKQREKDLWNSIKGSGSREPAD